MTIVQFGTNSAEARDEITQGVIERVQAEDECYVGGGLWQGRWVMRISVISYSTTLEDADRSVDSILRAWRTLRDAD